MRFDRKPKPEEFKWTARRLALFRSKAARAKASGAASAHGETAFVSCGFGGRHQFGVLLDAVHLISCPRCGSRSRWGVP